MESEALEIFDRIAELGGVVPGIETGFFQREIADSARRQQAEVESSQRFVVGVNEFTEGSEEVEIDTLKIDASVEERQRQRMADLRASRDDLEVARSLDELETSCRDGKNVVPGILECARAACTLYEIRHAMEKTFGSYKEPVFF